MEKVKGITVIGGGPAGAYCALELARRGIEVTIFDNSHPREKPCGGQISPLVSDNFPILREIVSKGGVTTKFKIISCKGTEAIVDQPDKVINVSRRYLDKEILGMAKKSGAKLVAERVSNVEKNGGLWRLETSGGTFFSELIVGADGVNSLVRRKTAGAISENNLALTFGYIAKGVRKEYSIVKFLNEMSGYIWVFPWRTFASIGIGGELSFGRRLRELLDKFLKSYDYKIRIVSKFSAMLPLVKDPSFFASPCAGEDWILVGDAAGHVDPITGCGILYALWSGKLAADAICQDSLEKYDLLWRQEYGNRLMERCRKRETFYDPNVIELLTVVQSVLGA